MSERDDLRRLRDRQDDYDADLAASPRTGMTGSPRRVARTITDGAYPTTRGRFFKLLEVTLSGSEVEGSAYTTTNTNTTYYAAHIGDAIPAEGTIVETVWVPYRWIMLYDGPSQGQGTTVGGDGYPTTAHAWYTIAVQDANGDPTGKEILAWNIGSSIPPADTLILFTYYLSRWEFQYG